MKKLTLVLISSFLFVSQVVKASWFDADYAHGQSQINAERLVDAMANNQVYFIDTREANEYQESHIPGAVNVPLRELDSVNVAELSQYKYVVPYCLKDFRGFEMAKSLRQLGLDNVVLMEPAGFNGWRKLGLPVIKAGQTKQQVLANWQPIKASNG